jgi:hypothetical protein
MKEPIMGASYGPGLNQHGLLEGSLDDQIEALVAFAWRAQALRLVEVIGGRVLELTQYDEVVTQRWLTGDEASGPLAAMRLGGSAPYSMFDRLDGFDLLLSDFCNVGEVNTPGLSLHKRHVSSYSSFARALRRATEAAEPEFLKELEQMQTDLEVCRQLDLTWVVGV